MGNTPKNKENKDLEYFDFPLSQCPDELLVHIMSLLPAKDVVKHCRLVCKHWKEMADSTTLWRSKLERIGCCPVRFDLLDLPRFCIFRPSTRNLLQNWNASEGMKSWTHDGSWITEKFPATNVVELDAEQECGACWATSYMWCVKYQVIDLVKEGFTQKYLDNEKPAITVSSWTAARRDCGSCYSLLVQISATKPDLELENILKDQWRLNEQDTERSVKDDSLRYRRSVPQWSDGEWVKVSHTFRDYPLHSRYVVFCDGGKDSQFWAGHYGPKMAVPTVMVSAK